MFFSSIEEINTLTSKGMSKIYLKVTIEKECRSQNFDFLSLKNSSPGQLLGNFNSRRYHQILKLLVSTYKSETWEENCEWLSYYLNFERNYEVSNSKIPCFLLNRNINFNKNERNRKWIISHTPLEKQTL